MNRQQRFTRLLETIAKNPGLNATQLRQRGLWHPKSCSLSEAEKEGLIVFKDGGWHVAHLTKS